MDLSPIYGTATGRGVGELFRLKLLEISLHRPHSLWNGRRARRAEAPLVGARVLPSAKWALQVGSISPPLRLPTLLSAPCHGRAFWHGTFAFFESEFLTQTSNKLLGRAVSLGAPLLYFTVYKAEHIPRTSKFKVTEPQHNSLS